MKDSVMVIEPESLLQFYGILLFLYKFSYMNNHQLDALSVLSLLNYHTYTCFGRINGPSSGGRM
jgi:hypothetical protein